MKTILVTLVSVVLFAPVASARHMHTSSAYGAKLGGGYAGTSRRSGIGSQVGTGWYSHGFGGTLNPGWGYGFGPNLGGSGR